MSEQGLLPYVDVPLQHASPSVLKTMRRSAAAEYTLRRIQNWRNLPPRLTIRSTFMVGFPRETEEDFQVLLGFLEQAQLDRVGCFTYSPVQDSAANEVPDPIPEAVNQKRLGRFTETQTTISQARLAGRIGREETVLMDSAAGGKALARNYSDAPDIDGVVHVAHARAAAGDWLRFRITDADQHDLYAE